MNRAVVALASTRVAVLAASAVLVAVVGGPALATAGPAGAVRHSAAPACTVTWVGLASRPLWTIGKNWSTGQVPGSASDVCIGTGVDVLTDVSISIHSLQLGRDAGIALEGTATQPLTATVATSVDLTPGGISRIDLTDATINAARIDDQGGTIFTDGTCELNSPDVVFGAGGNLRAANGKTTLTSLPQLSNGTLTGAGLFTADAVVVVPADITAFVASTISVGAHSEIEDAASRNALTGLTSIDGKSSLSLDSSLALTSGGLVANGNVSLFSATLAVPGAFTQTAGALSLFGNAVVRAGAVQVDSGASLLAYQGRIAGNLINDGLVDAFGPSATQVTGGYKQAPTATLESGFSGPLAVAGKATLAGAVFATEGFPTIGDTSPVITFGSVSGAFARHNLGIVLIAKPVEIDAVIHPQIAASRRTAAPGQTVTVTGASFVVGSLVRVFLDHVGGTPLARTLAEYRGDFQVIVKISSAAKAGSHNLIAVGIDNEVAKTSIKVS